MDEASEAAITVCSLRKTYGEATVVDGIDFVVRRGEVFALLGPNGAGKTTTVEILEGFRRRDAGEVSVLGVDPQRPTRAWRERIGIVLQACEVEPELTVRESLELFAGYFTSPRDVDGVLSLVGLRDVASRRAGRLSGGQQRRLDVALGLIGDPELLFLDEPTVGFDPSARHQFWDVIRNLRALGTTVVLTTHDMAEAQALADRVAVMVKGRLVADAPVSEIGGRALAVSRITFTLPAGIGAGDLPGSLPSGVTVREGRVELHTDAVMAALHELTNWGRERDLDLPDLEVRRPTLEEIYLGLTDGSVSG